jgi:protein involved in ribonucleotide reduction
LLIIYASKTGNVERFVNKLNLRSIKIKEGLIVNEPFVLITYTTGFGEVPKEVQNFLRFNRKFLKGVAASGNMNWGNKYAASADEISKKYGVPVIYKFELSGTSEDVKRFKEEVHKLDKNCSSEMD